MAEQTQSPPTPKKIGLGQVLGWIWACITVPVGILAAAEGHVVAGAFFVLTGLIALPYARRMFGFELSAPLRLVAVIGFVIGAGWALPTPRLGESRSVPVTATSSPAPASYAPKVLLDETGSGTKSTATFTTQGNDWDLAYTFDCTNFGTRGNFQVFIKTGDGQLADLPGPNELSMGTTDLDHYHTGGTFFLEVNSECTWHVTVTG